MAKQWLRKWKIRVMVISRPAFSTRSRVRPCQLNQKVYTTSKWGEITGYLSRQNIDMEKIQAKRVEIADEEIILLKEKTFSVV